MGRILTGPGSVAKRGDTMLGAFNEAKGIDIPSATTINLVTSTGNLVDITGNNSIVSINLAPGAERVLRFVDVLRIFNSSTLVLPGNVDITTTPGDFAIIRGYPQGVVRVVVYTRASGTVQRIGDTMLGTLTLVPGYVSSPPLKFQPGTITNIPVPNAMEWNGASVYLTTGVGVRKQLLYTNGDGSQLTNFTPTQITNGLGYTPFNPALSSAVLNPPGSLVESGRYIDMHYANNANDFDVRFECQAPAGGYGSSVLNVTAYNISVNGVPLASTANPIFTGHVGLPSGSAATPGLYFTSELGNDSGFYLIGDGIIGVSSNGVPIAAFTTSGILAQKGSNVSGAITLEKSTDAVALQGHVKMDLLGDKLRFFDTGGTNRGAYMDMAEVAANVGSKIITSDQVGGTTGASGWQKMAGGMIMQWGKVSNVGTGYVTMTFPITFPTACVSLITSYDMTNQRGSYGSGGAVSATGASVYTDSCDTWWLALGY